MTICFMCVIIDNLEEKKNKIDINTFCKVKINQLNKMELTNFQENTYDIDLFRILNVVGDNKCFYRSIIVNLLAMTDLNKRIDPYNLVLKKVFKNYNPIINLDNIDLEYQDRAIYNLENRVIKWISKNRQNVDNPVGLSISEIISMTHGISIDEYIKRDYDEFPIWGGLPEQIAISNIYKIPIYIFRAVQFNKKTNKINEGIIVDEKPNKNTRLQLVQIINPMSDRITNQPIYLLWKHYSNGDDHYMALLPKINNLVI